jgi:prepilin-type N-terminal cleavage/methylation domain-containing protein
MQKCLQPLKAVITDKRGFTLVELLLVVALVGIVLAIPIQALFLTNRDWQYNQAMSPALMDGNLLFARLGNEIRAADKPEGGTRAVEIEDEQLIIYRPNSEAWERIEYRFLEDSHELQRGAFSGSEAQVLNRTGNPVSWETVASSVTALNFSDNNPGSTADRRLIRVAMQISDTTHSQPSFQPFLVESTFLSRSQQSGTGSSGSESGGEGSTDVAVRRISLTPTSVSMREGEETTLTATIAPANATNKNVTWSSSNSGRVTVTGNGLTATIRAVNQGGATISVTTANGGYTAQCIVEVRSSGGC